MLFIYLLLCRKRWENKIERQAGRQGQRFFYVKKSTNAAYFAARFFSIAADMIIIYNFSYSSVWGGWGDVYNVMQKIVSKVVA